MAGFQKSSQGIELEKISKTLKSRRGNIMVNYAIITVELAENSVHSPLKHQHNILHQPGCSNPILKGLFAPVSEHLIRRKDWCQGNFAQIQNFLSFHVFLLFISSLFYSYLNTLLLAFSSVLHSTFIFMPPILLSTASMPLQKMCQQVCKQNFYP